MVAGSLLVQSDKIFYIQHVLMHKSIALVYKTVLGIENFRVSSVNYVLNYVSVLIHFSLGVVVFIFAAFRLFFFVFIFLLFLTIFTHHILFSKLVIAIVHFCKLLLLEKLEFLQLDKLYIFNRALRWLFHFIINHFGQYWVCRNVIYFLLLIDLIY